MTTAVEHLERFLGPIDVGWSVDTDGTSLPFQVARFKGSPRPGTVAFATVGLGRAALHSPLTGRVLRHELLMIVGQGQQSQVVPAILQQVGSGLLRSGRALRRGDIVGPAGPLVGGSSMVALYVAAPVYLPDDFGEFLEEDQTIVIAWLVPISSREAAFVASHGWRAFEDTLAASDPDLTDLTRPTIIV